MTEKEIIVFIITFWVIVIGLIPIYVKHLVEKHLKSRANQAIKANNFW